MLKLGRLSSSIFFSAIIFIASGLLFPLYGQTLYDQIVVKEEFLEDSNCTIIASDLPNIKFEGLEKKPVRLLNFSSCYWKKVQVLNNTNEKLCIIFERSWYEIIMYHLSDNGQLTVKRGGMNTPFENWEVSYNAPGFEIPISDSVQTFYFRARTDVGGQLGFYIQKYPVLLKSSTQNQLYYGISLGALFLAIVISFSLYIILGKNFSCFTAYMLLAFYFLHLSNGVL